MKSADIKNRQWTAEEHRAIRTASQLQAAGDDSGISFDEIPRLTRSQLAAMVRRRPSPRKVAVSVRLDAQVLDWLKAKGQGHLTRINDILANVMDAERNSR